MKILNSILIKLIKKCLQNNLTQEIYNYHKVLNLIIKLLLLISLPIKEYLDRHLKI